MFSYSEIFTNTEWDDLGYDSSINMKSIYVSYIYNLKVVSYNILNLKVVSHNILSTLSNLIATYCNVRLAMEFSTWSIKLVLAFWEYFKFRDRDAQPVA